MYRELPPLGSKGRGGQPGQPPPLWHSALTPRAPNLWAKVTAPAAQGTCDQSAAELEQATQSGHCAKHAGPLAKTHPIPSLPGLSGALIYRGSKLGRCCLKGLREGGYILGDPFALVWSESQE